MVAPVGSETRCLTRHILRSFGARTNIYNAKSARSAEDKVDPRNPCHILQLMNNSEYTYIQADVHFINGDYSFATNIKNPAKSSIYLISCTSTC